MAVAQTSRLKKAAPVILTFILVLGLALPCGIPQAQAAPSTADVEAAIIQGNGQTWTKGSADGLTFMSNQSFQKYPTVIVKLDNAFLSEGDQYTAAAGTGASTLISISAAYCQTLGVGKHTIQIQSIVPGASPKVAAGTFHVRAANDPNRPMVSFTVTVDELPAYGEKYVAAPKTSVVAKGSDSGNWSVTGTSSVVCDASGNPLEHNTVYGEGTYSLYVIFFVRKDGEYSDNFNRGLCTLIDGKGASLAMTLDSQEGFKQVYMREFTLSAPAPAPGASKVQRLGGEDRYKTMEKIDAEGFPKASTVIVATGDDFPDALAAGALAGLQSAPIVLTSGKALSAEARAEILRLGAKNVIIVGGKAAVSDDVEKVIRGIAGIASVRRFEGPDRVGTSLAIYQGGSGSWSKTAIVATGYKFADALSVGPYAYAKKAPIFLAEKDGTLSAAAAAAIKGGSFERVLIVGGTSVVAESVATRQLSGMNVQRIAGADRYETSQKIAEAALKEGITCTAPAVATGQQYPDALCGAAMCGAKNSIILLADQDQKGGMTAIDSVLKAHRQEVGTCYLLGGTSAVSPKLETAIKGILE